MKIKTLFMLLVFFTEQSIKSQEITPYKFINSSNAMPAYKIPDSSRFQTKRPQKNISDIIYYLSKPEKNSYPIALLCSGSSSKNNLASIIHFHRYFLKEFLDLGIGVLTIEQRGIDGNKINVDEFMEYYTRSARINDHRVVIQNLALNPPVGWNGKFIFLGVSEGGPLVTNLTNDYQEKVIATINWSGAGDWPWQEELWMFIVDLNNKAPWYMRGYAWLSQWLPLSYYIPKTREEYNNIMDQILKKPDSNKTFMGMTYKYHADALIYGTPDYSNIRTPFLVITGAQDSIIYSSDLFVEKARKTGVPITYLRIPDMGHYIRKRPDIIQESFEWLKLQLEQD